MLQRLIQNYSDRDEFEIRYYVDPRKRGPCEPAKYPESVKSIIESILANIGASNCEHTKFIDLWFPNSVRKRVMFGATRCEEWIRKERKVDSWTEHNDFGGFRVSLSRETEIDPIPHDRVDRILAKYRLSKQWDTEWRIDVSAVKCTTLAAAQDTKRRLIACNSPITEWSWWDYWEFEVEYIGGDAPPSITTQDIYAWYEIFAPHVKFRMLDEVRRVSTLVSYPRQNTFAKISGRNTIARLLPKAVEPTLDQWSDEICYSLAGMVLRDKIDGRRELLVIQNGTLIAISARDIEEWEEPQENNTYVFDTEYSEPCDKWYILHPLIIKGRNVTGMSDGERMRMLADNMPAIDNIEICPWMIVQDPEKDITSWQARVTPYYRDGLLLAVDGAYWSQKCYKWKPAEESSLDMLAVKCPEWLEGKAPYLRADPEHTLYLLNIGVSSSLVAKHNGFPLKRYLEMFGIDKSTQYIPQPFAPLDNPHAYIWSTERNDLHGYICEMLYTNHNWKLKRIRDDKPSILRGGTEIGNDVRTAMDVWSKQTTPFPLEYLWGPPVDTNSQFADIAPAVESIIMDLFDEEPVQNALQHMVPFVPFPKTMNMDRVEIVPESGFDEYRTIRLSMPRVTYTHIGRLTMPKEFIGGAQLVVTMDPELLAHVSCVGKMVSSGGRILVICRTGGSPRDDKHPLVNKTVLVKDFERSGFTLSADYGAPQSDNLDIIDSRFDAWNLLLFRKENRGSSNMTTAEVHKENPHLVGNPDANFGMKFMRQKTKDLLATNTLRDACETLEVNPKRGELLTDIEFLITLDDTAQVLYIGDQLDKLSVLFPKIQWLTRDTATSQNTEALISHVGYRQSVELITEYDPHASLVDIDADDMRDGPVLRGKFIFIPMLHWDSTRVALQIGRYRDTWNVIPDMFAKEMYTFHRIYRASAFKYAQRPNHLDNCYDCRAQQYILCKYSRCQKIKMTMNEIYKQISV